jgi:hypothetical protein
LIKADGDLKIENLLFSVLTCITEIIFYE